MKDTSYIIDNFSQDEINIIQDKLKAQVIAIDKKNKTG